MSTELIYADATELAELIRTREVSPVEVVQAHLDRIASINPKVNAIVTLADDALKNAKEAEAAVQRGETLGPLHGVPFTAKDSIDTAATRFADLQGKNAGYRCHGDKATQRSRCDSAGEDKSS